MSRTPMVVLAVVAPLVSCAVFNRATPESRAAGTYVTSLAVDGRSTYTGAMTLGAAGRDSVRGNMRLTSPINVDVILVGSVRGDSLLLRGTYTAANGCTGSLAAPLRVGSGGAAEGRFELADRCAGTLKGVLKAVR